VEVMFAVLWIYCLCFFFFSSRRRHTRSKRDWSSDVCSSDTGFIGCKAAPVACLGSVKASLGAVRPDTRSGVGRFLARRELSFAFMQDSFIFRCGYTALLKGLIPWHRRSRFT